MMDMSYSKCANTLNKVKRKIDTEGVKTYRRLYALLVISERNKHTDLVDEIKAAMLYIYKQCKGAGLFVSGEFTEYFIANLGDTVVDSDRQCIKEVLGVEISRKPREEVEKKEFKELEPAFKSKDGPIRGGKGKEKKKVKEARKKAKIESHKHVMKTRKDDREYADRLQRMEQSLRRQ